MLLLALSLSSCLGLFDEEEHNVELKIVNNTSINIVTGLYCKSGSSAHKAGTYFDQLYSVGMYSRIGDNCKWLLITKGDRFNDVFNAYGIDSLSLLVSTSVYNLLKWRETHEDEYLLASYPFTPENMKNVGVEYTVEFVPHDDCYIHIINNPHTSLVVALACNKYKSSSMDYAEVSEFVSIIGKGFHDKEITCPTGFKCKNFDMLFRRLETPVFSILLAESEEKIGQWCNSHSDSLLIGTYVFQEKDVMGNDLFVDLGAPE